MRRWFVALALLGAASCTDVESTCTPGRSAPCTCSDGLSGAQVCLDEGVFAACECAGIAGDAGSDASR